MFSGVLDPKSDIFETFPSIEYWNAVDCGNELAGNVYWDGGSSIADRE